MSNLSMASKTDEPVHFKAGSVIFAQGKPSKYLYLVKSGEVMLVKFKGQNLVGIQLCEEKDILNEVSVLLDQPNELTAIAKTDVELVLVSQKEILSAMKTAPGWVPDILKVLCGRLQHTQAMIEEHHLAEEKDLRLKISKEEEKKYINALAEFNSGHD